MPDDTEDNTANQAKTATPLTIGGQIAGAGKPLPDASAEMQKGTLDPNATKNKTVSGVLGNFKSDINDLKFRADALGFTRELSMFKTKLDEAYHWLRDHLEAL